MSEKRSDNDPAVPATGQRSESTEPAERGPALDELAERDGWRVEGGAARVHYSGATDRYSIEYYARSDSVLYWTVPPEAGGDTAQPVAREDVPTPLRERIREDLAGAGVDPAIERRSL